MTKLVGILNITPDSFSDGGSYNTADRAMLHAKQLIADGADILDIGAESTRPNARVLTDAEEWERLSPILAPIIKLAHTHHVDISIDTYHPATAKHAVELGVDYINDVSSFSSAKMCNIVAPTNVKLIIMHSVSIPADKNKLVQLADGEDIITHLKQFITQKIEQLAQYGIAKERIIFDPGIGFGKTAKQSLEILGRLSELKSTNTPLYIGHSRKSFLKTVAGQHPTIEELDRLTLLCSELIAPQADYLRIHNVTTHKNLLHY